MTEQNEYKDMPVSALAEKYYRLELKLHTTEDRGVMKQILSQLDKLTAELLRRDEEAKV